MLTLPTDSTERKKFPMCTGLLQYFPAALAGVAAHSQRGNEKHNPGQPLHHSRGKSMDHEDCIVRHLVDMGDFMAAVSEDAEPDDASVIALLQEADALSWRALALSQQLYERFGGKPVAPRAWTDDPENPAECEEIVLSEDPPATWGKGIERTGDIAEAGTAVLSQAEIAQASVGVADEYPGRRVPAGGGPLKLSCGCYGHCKGRHPEGFALAD